MLGVNKTWCSTITAILAHAPKQYLLYIRAGNINTVYQIRTRSERVNQSPAIHSTGTTTTKRSMTSKLVRRVGNADIDLSKRIDELRGWREPLRAGTVCARYEAARRVSNAVELRVSKRSSRAVE